MPSRRDLLTAAAGASAALAGCSVLDREQPIEEPLDEFATATFRNGLQRRGYRPEQTVPHAVEVAWTLPAVNTGEHTAAKASCVTADGTVLFPGDDGRLRAVRPDGSVAWTAKTRATDGRGMHGTPTVANGVAYVGAYDGAMYAFDVDDGALRWRTPLAAAIGSSPAYHDGRVFVAVEHSPPGGTMIALDAADGSVTWRGTRPTDHPHSTCAVDREHGKLVVGANDGNCYAWEYPSLEFAWSYGTNRPIKGPIATHDGAAFFGSWNEHVLRVDLETGDLDWAFNATARVMSGPSVDPDRGVVYVGSNGYSFHALDAETGDELWSLSAAGAVSGCPAATGEHVVFGDTAGVMRCVRAEDGREVWRAEHDGWVNSTPLLTDDGIFYTERATDAGPGKGYCLRPA